jgi:hypothetical protein
MELLTAKLETMHLNVDIVLHSLQALLTSLQLALHKDLKAESLRLSALSVITSGGGFSATFSRPS